MSNTDRQTKSQKRSRKRQMNIIGTITLFVVIAVGVYTLYLQQEKDRLAESIRQVEEEIAEEEQRAQELEQEKETLDSRQSIEEIARQKLGLFYPGETVLKPETGTDD